MQYVVKRNPVLYTNSGELSPICYYKGTQLGLTILTMKVEEAKRFTTKAEASKTAKLLGRKYDVVKL